MTKNLHENITDVIIWTVLKNSHVFLSNLFNSSCFFIFLNVSILLKWQPLCILTVREVMSADLNLFFQFKMVISSNQISITNQICHSNAIFRGINYLDYMQTSSKSRFTTDFNVSISRIVESILNSFFPKLFWINSFKMLRYNKILNFLDTISIKVHFLCFF